MQLHSPTIEMKNCSWIHFQLFREYISVGAQMLGKVIIKSIHSITPLIFDASKSASCLLWLLTNGVKAAAVRWSRPHPPPPARNGVNIYFPPAVKNSLSLRFTVHDSFRCPPSTTTTRQPRSFHPSRLFHSRLSSAPFTP